jgi:endo-alpha-1,4-polygalactosaminidase (GH114 family)
MAVGNLVGIVFETFGADRQIVMAVVAIACRDKAVQRFVEVIDEAALALVDHDSARGVRRVNEHHAVDDAASGNHRNDVVRDVDELAATLRFEVVVLKEMLDRAGVGPPAHA